MRFLKTKLAVLGAALVVAACGGGGAGDQHPRVPFTALVSFGDSLSDVGNEKVGTIAAVGGGKWTVNSPTARNWTEWIAADIGASAPCAAQTGLLTNIPGLTGAAVVQHTECNNYAEGSARVSNVFGPNSATLQAAPFSQVNLGLTATPLTAQVANYLSRHNGAFSGTELVTVLAGGNDIFMNVNAVGAAAGGGAGAVGAAIAAGWDASTQGAVAGGGAAAVQAAATAAVTSMGVAGAELAGLVKAQMLAKGAKYVVVVNLPDVTQSPGSMALDAQTRGLIGQMVQTFNAQLSAGLQGTGVVYVDAYTQGQDQIAHPQQYSLANVTTAACSSTSPANPFASVSGRSITCSEASVISGDVTHYLFADDTGHLTPYGYQLLAQYVAVQIAKAGWL
ncbi:SGNH/GDSL hydrolase family protein [Ramlibacter sp. PS4R-6]|uniref:SGNH/GDSL hydrolase family protein n=1 Tax=Ramlibacter sp. PS4R-6 TaxID=3133438 RepID=UPI0030B21687